ncbi:DUF1294 domain-containing protein [Bacillaceae bacterium W0354]
MLIIFVLLNVFGFILMGLDKYYAIKRKWRISERALWTVALASGAAGMWIGMLIFRHKTKHYTFKYGLPLLTIIWTGIIIYLS